MGTRHVHVEEDLGDAVDDSCQIAEAAVDHSKNVANARKQLQAVVASDESVVPWVWVQLVAVHDDHSGCRDS